MNEILFFASIIIGFCLVLVFYKFFGRLGLFLWISIVAIIANIEILKCVDIFGVPVTLGNELFCSIALATDIINEKYGGKEARKSAWIGFLSLSSLVLLSQIALLFEPNNIDFASNAMETIFSTTPRLCVASLLCFLVSNIFDTYVFAWLKTRFSTLWVRVNISTFISQFVDSMLFCLLAFTFELPFKEVIVLGLTMYATKVIITMFNTPFVYLSKKIKPLHD